MEIRRLETVCLHFQNYGENHRVTARPLVKKLANKTQLILDTLAPHREDITGIVVDEPDVRDSEIWRRLSMALCRKWFLIIIRKTPQAHSSKPTEKASVLYFSRIAIQAYALSQNIPLFMYEENIEACS